MANCRQLLKRLQAFVLPLAIAVSASSAQAGVSNADGRPGPAAIHKVTADILARSEFHADTSESWRVKAVNWLIDTLAGFLRWLSGKSGLNLSESSFFVRAVIVVTVVVIAVAAWLLLMRLVRFSGRKKNAQPSPDAVVSHRRASAQELARKAFAQAENGDIGEAFRLLYVALLFSLDRSGMINWNRSSTNWDYVRALKSDGRAGLAEEVEELTRVFDLTHYGARACRVEHYEACLKVYSSLQVRTPGGIGLQGRAG
ncbi:MAG: DUF4129 domain-containing protein [Armatimonadota bacterium]|nr:DUF4129 domain-containing protein [Armatimonadota bacterium]